MGMETQRLQRWMMFYEDYTSLYEAVVVLRDLMQAMIFVSNLENSIMQSVPHSKQPTRTS